MDVMDAMDWMDTLGHDKRGIHIGCSSGKFKWSPILYSAYTLVKVFRYSTQEAFESNRRRHADKRLTGKDKKVLY
jgi:hypothetical protein